GDAVADRQPQQRRLGAGRTARARNADRSARAADPGAVARDAAARRRLRGGSGRAGRCDPGAVHRRRRRAARLRDRRHRADRVRGVHGGPDRRAHHRTRGIAAAAVRSGRSRADAGRRSARPVRVRLPLSGRRDHRNPGCPLPDPPAHPHQPHGRLPVTESHTLAVEGITLGYGDRTVIDGLDLAIAPGKITAIVGSNGCGKSTLLRAMARLLRPEHGAVMLDGADVRSLATKAVARVVGLLPQSPIAPEGIAVADLVGRGRHPHQKTLARWSARDYEVVADALEATGIADLADRSVDELSGGQRQRVWIAMALAQETDILLLDEPTTFLDVAHQVEV